MTVDTARDHAINRWRKGSILLLHAVAEGTQRAVEEVGARIAGKLDGVGHTSQGGDEVNA